MSDDKLGTYITKLMTTIVNKDSEDFVKDLAMSELSRLKVDIDSFLKKHISEKENKETEKQLLQEKKENGK